MVVIYTSHGCASCRKVKTWLKEKDIQYVEKNIFKTLLNNKEIKYLLTRSERGSDDIISKRSKVIKDNNIDIDALSINELCDFVINNPSVLRRPIIISNKNMQIGFDEDEIDAFDRQELKDIGKCDKNCPHYKTCGSLREEK